MSPCDIIKANPNLNLIKIPSLNYKPTNRMQAPYFIHSAKL